MRKSRQCYTCGRPGHISMHCRRGRNRDVGRSQQPGRIFTMDAKEVTESDPLMRGELELPFLALLLVILSSYEVMRFRDTKEGAIISLLIAVYLAYQHFSRTSLQKSLEQGSIIATIAVVCIAIASLLFLI
ncbi:Cold-regulated inner membrane protein [Arachis hypogaea]|nr:Cold-regulated inner membrane protein [Arachis hypogaea]